MGITSSLFFSSNDPEKQTLHRRITPTNEQFDQQQVRWNDIADHLIDDLRARSGYSMRTWLQGSYKFGTQIRPPRKGAEYDIDLGIYFEWDGDAEDGDHEPQALKNMVQESLLAYNDEGVVEVVAPPKSRCSRIRFTGDFHIDVPSYHLDSDSDIRTLATSDGWEVSDPKRIYLWFRNRFDDQARAKIRRQVRYLKIWAGLEFPGDADRPSSILLTVLASEAAGSLTAEDMASDDDCLLAILSTIIERLEKNPTVLNPASKVKENLARNLVGERFDSFLAKLRHFRQIAEIALSANDLVTAADKWSDAFGHFFPMPDEEELKQIVIAERAALPANVFTPEVHVKAVSRDNKFAKWESMNLIGPVPRNCDIEFTIANREEIPAGATIHWMVRNEGDEAEDINDLGHSAGSGLTAREHSAYKGTHFMDCVARFRGQIIGMRRIPVEITGMTAPKRNPHHKPTYVRLFGRR
ncbi:MAG TPA: CBASS cGAMP synthase [Dongiaceae bacterium]|jgi:hypothetical protein|nr:CBASS cGAMP synthase [Dongiaceae bacterium]